jgi:hypothetical protein
MRTGYVFKVATWKNANIILNARTHADVNRSMDEEC